mmetsp:Transcript_48640/g.135931  ORF Transcript_48640/g.135931 Transcript_48640/m.135931 type:complete len:517 (-) Transcript_48640:834-2384(-)
MAVHAPSAHETLGLCKYLAPAEVHELDDQVLPGLAVAEQVLVESNTRLESLHVPAIGHEPLTQLLHGRLSLAHRGRCQSTWAHRPLKLADGKHLLQQHYRFLPVAGRSHVKLPCATVSKLVNDRPPNGPSPRWEPLALAPDASHQVFEGVALAGLIQCLRHVLEQVAQHRCHKGRALCQVIQQALHACRRLLEHLRGLAHVERGGYNACHQALKHVPNDGGHHRLHDVQDVRWLGWFASKAARRTASRPFAVKSKQVLRGREEHGAKKLLGVARRAPLLEGALRSALCTMTPQDVQVVDHAPEARMRVVRASACAFHVGHVLPDVCNETWTVPPQKQRDGGQECRGSGQRLVVQLTEDLRDVEIHQLHLLRPGLLVFPADHPQDQGGVDVGNSFLRQDCQRAVMGRGSGRRKAKHVAVHPREQRRGKEAQPHGRQRLREALDDLHNIEPQDFRAARLRHDLLRELEVRRDRPGLQPEQLPLGIESKLGIDGMAIELLQCDEALGDRFHVCGGEREL